MLDKVFLVIADILKENKIVVADFIKILEKCNRTISIIKDVTDKENQHINEVAEIVKAFMLLLELIKLYEENKK